MNGFVSMINQQNAFENVTRRNVIIPGEQETEVGLCIFLID